MADRRDDFDRAARAAAGEGRDGERDLAGILGKQFQQDPETFDPQRLTQLRRTELMQFLEQIVGRELPVSVATESETMGEVDKTSSDWRDLRRSETSNWLGDVGIGVACGSVILVFALIAGLILY